MTKCTVNNRIVSNFQVQMGITLEKLNGPGYTTNVHIFIYISRISQSIEFYPCYASLDLEILRQFTMRFVITTPPTCLMRCLFDPVTLTFDLENNNISWRSISPISKPYFVKKSSNGELLCLNAHNCTLESKDVQGLY
jgi:hypothetical protein